MANITLLGASYAGVPAVTLPQTGGGTATFFEDVVATLSYTNTLWRPDKTFAELEAALLAGNTISFYAYDSVRFEPIPTSYKYYSNMNMIQYWVTWIDSETGYRVEDSYSYNQYQLIRSKRTYLDAPDTIKYEQISVTPTTTGSKVQPTGTYMSGAGTITLNRSTNKAYLPLTFPATPVVGQSYQLYIYFNRTGKNRTYTYHNTFTWNGFNQNITITEDGQSRTITGYFEDSDATYFVFNLGTSDDDDNTETAEVILTDLGYDYRGLLCVEVEPIPSEYVIPAGTLNVVSNGTYNVKNYASASVAVPTSGADLPIFNIQWDSTWTTRTITCNETFAQCWNRYNNGIDTGAYIIETVDGDSYVRHDVASVVAGQANNHVTYTIGGASGPLYDIVYHANGTIEVVDPSAYTHELSVTENGSYFPSKGVYTHVSVNVPSWTKVAETSYQISTTSTSAATHATWATGNSNLWTKADWIYVRIRDTEGKRNGYFYGSDQFFYNTNLANSGTVTNITSSIRIYTRYNNDQYTTTATSATTGYGVWADTLYTDGRIRIRKRYNSTSSLTVNSTYKVEAYILTSAGGVSIYE